MPEGREGARWQSSVSGLATELSRIGGVSCDLMVVGYTRSSTYLPRYNDVVYGIYVFVVVVASASCCCRL